MTSRSHAFSDTGRAISQAFSAPRSPCLAPTPKSSLNPARPDRVPGSDLQSRNGGHGPWWPEILPKRPAQALRLPGGTEAEGDKNRQVALPPNPALVPPFGHVPQPETPAGPVTPQTLGPLCHLLRLLPAHGSPRSHPAGSGPK